MDGQDKQRLVQQYVERQRAYLPTYTAEHLLDAFLGTPSKQPRGDEFGFDTPVLRPRVPAKEGTQSPLALRADPNKGAREAQQGRHGEARSLSGTRDPALDKERTRSKRRKVSTPIDTDNENERAARLANRRERKRAKRAIVNQQDPAPKKAKRPTALALLYGFSATNVTKDRLTVKPAPCLGVFSKGRASAKKKVTTTTKSCEHSVDVSGNSAALKNSASRNALFSETAFLNRSSEQASDRSKVEDNSSVSNQPVADKVRISKRAKKDRGKCVEVADSKKTRASTRTAAESEVWDIEMQSKLPSSVADVSGELEEKDSAPVVINIRGAEWSASLDVAGREEGGFRKKASCSSITRSLPGGHFTARNPSHIGSDQHDETRLVRAADAPSIHPSHSASQVGCRVADHQPPDQRLVASKYFAEPNPAVARESNGNHPQSSRLHDDIQEFAANSLSPSGSLLNQRPGTPVYFTELESVSAGNHMQLRLNDDGGPGPQIPDQMISHTASNAPMLHRVASPIDSLTSFPQPMVTFQTSYDMMLDLPSHGTSDNDYGSPGAPWESGPSGGYVQRSTHDDWCDVTALEQAVEHPDHGGDTWDWYGPSSGIATYDVELDGAYDDPLVPEFQEDPSAPHFFETPATDGPRNRNPGRWSYMDEAGQDFATCDDEYSEYDDAADFLEGRALLLGVTEGHEEPRCAGLSGLVQAEMDVASRLRDHWRPLRL